MGSLSRGESSREQHQESQPQKAAPANQEKLPLSTTKTPLPTTKTPLSMEHCCQSCGFSRPVAAFQSGFETLQICSTCQERNARAKARSRAWRRVALAPLPESELNCPRERVEAQQQQARPKQ